MPDHTVTTTSTVTSDGVIDVDYCSHHAGLGSAYQCNMPSLQVRTWLLTAAPHACHKGHALSRTTHQNSGGMYLFGSRERGKTRL